MIHHLKCDEDPFRAIWNGDKKAEFRLNDRDYQVNDELVLQLGKEDISPRPWMRCRVTHIQTGYGIPDNYVMMSIIVTDRGLK